MIAFYMDENVNGAITRGLRRRGVDVVTAQGDIPRGTPDDLVLARATQLGRVLFSQDEDLLREAALCQRVATPFAGVIFAPQSLPVGRCVEDLEIIAAAGSPVEFANAVRYLPL